MVSGVGRGIGVLLGVVIVEGKGSFGGEFGASLCNQRGLYDALGFRAVVSAHVCLTVLHIWFC